MKTGFVLLISLFAGCVVCYAQGYITSKKNVERNITKAMKKGDSYGVYSYSLESGFSAIPLQDLQLYFKENSNTYVLVDSKVFHLSAGYTHTTLERFRFKIINPNNLPEDQKKIISPELKNSQNAKFYSKMDNLMTNIFQPGLKKKPKTFKGVSWGEKNLSDLGDCKECHVKETWDLQGISVIKVKAPSGALPKELFFQYMHEKGYYICKAYVHSSDPNYVATFLFHKQSVIDDKLKQNMLAEKQKKELEEQKRIKAENDRKKMLAENEIKYNQQVQDARKKAATKNGWTVIEFKDGYYLGEAKDGKRQGYGEYYWKNLEPIEDLWSANISYKGGWLDDKFSGQGELKNYYKTSNTGLWTAYYRHYCTTYAKFVNGKAEGEGYYSKQVTGFLAGNDTYDRVLFSNGAIVKNYTEEARQAQRDLIKSSDCFSLLGTQTVSYYDGGDRTATGYKIKCVPPSKYSLEKIIYYNPGGDRYLKGWYNNDGDALFQDSKFGAGNDDTFEKAAKKACGCY